jgi:hypothetical protein
MSNFKVGDRVFVPSSANGVWAGTGEVTYIYTKNDKPDCLRLKMLTGDMAGSTGAFDVNELLPSDMEIVSIKRSTQSTGLKIYGKILGESGKTYNFAYIRRPNFRGWICSCDSFFFEMFKKGRNCKHLKYVRSEVGRYGTKVNQDQSTIAKTLSNHVI